MKILVVLDIKRMCHLAYTTKLVFQSDSDKESVMEVLHWQKLAFDECSKVVFGLEKKSIVDLHANFYANFRKSQGQIPSQVIITAQRECLSKYKSAKSNKYKISEPITKSNLGVQLDKRIYSIKGDTLSVISSDGRVKCQPYFYPKLRELWLKYRVCDPVLFVRNGEIWISVVFETPDEKLPQTSAVGLDLGVRLFAVSSEGEVYDDKKFKARKRQVRFLKRNLQSKGTKSARKKLRKLRHTEANLSKDFIHRKTNEILSEVKADVIALENLKGIKKKKHPGQNKSAISQVSLFEFRRILTYKAPFYRKTVILVDPRFTSQLDSRTGKKDGERRGRRYYGADGVVLDADYNAAINIVKRSKLPASFDVPLDGTLNFRGQAAVNPPLAFKSTHESGIVLQVPEFIRG